MNDRSSSHHRLMIKSFISLSHQCLCLLVRKMCTHNIFPDCIVEHLLSEHYVLIHHWIHLSDWSSDHQEKDTEGKEHTWTFWSSAMAAMFWVAFYIPPNWAMGVSSSVCPRKKLISWKRCRWYLHVIEIKTLQFLAFLQNWLIKIENTRETFIEFHKFKKCFRCGSTD